MKHKVTATPGQPRALGAKDPTTGKTLFSEGTKCAVVNAIKKLHHVIPKIPTEQLFRVANAPPKAKHNLPICRSVGSESPLESFHAILGNMGNTNMERDTTDAFALLGVARYNARVREQNKVAVMAKEEVSVVPHHLRDAPVER